MQLMMTKRQAIHVVIKAPTAIGQKSYKTAIKRFVFNGCPKKACQRAFPTQAFGHLINLIIKIALVSYDVLFLFTFGVPIHVSGVRQTATITIQVHRVSSTPTPAIRDDNNCDINTMKTHPPPYSVNVMEKIEQTLDKE